jgi:hypothetical protein
MTSTRQFRPAFQRALLPLLIGASLCAAWAGPAVAASHREAPFIATQPQLDGTDFYMFRSYETGREGYVTLVADYLPLQAPYGGPNYVKLDPNAIYEIHVTNNGGAVENVSFQFKFQNTLADNQFTVGGKKVSIPLAQNGSGDVSTPGSSALNVHETYSLFVYYGPRALTIPAPVTNVTKGGTTFDKPVDYIGNKTISNYVAYANQHIWEIAVPGCSGTGRVFVGQRKDPFRVNLGETFDLVNIKYPATELLAGAEFATVDSLHDSNVTALALELPIACLIQGKGDIIGGWTTPCAQASLALETPGSASITSQIGSYVQVSRLGAPLVNEVVIGLKDRTSSTPASGTTASSPTTSPTPRCRCCSRSCSAARG